MESITKNRQTEKTLRAMVERAYGAGQAPDTFEELGFGWFNVAYRIRLRSGDQVVLKIAPPAGVEVMAYERGAMAVELAALDLIRARTTVPVPRVDYADRSHDLCDADYFFMPFIEGDNLALLKNAEEMGDAVGAVTRELNAIRGTAFGSLLGPGEKTWRSAFLRMMDELLGDGERRGVDLDYDAIREMVSAHASCLDEVTEPRFVDWDLWSGNCLVRDGRIVAVLDHERAFFGDPLMEFGFTASELPAYGDATAFLRGYGRRPFTGNERIRRRLYNLYLVLVQVIETVFREFPGTDQFDWASARLTEAMAALKP